MKDDEYEFILEDRIAKIQAIDYQLDLRNKSAISWSGGLDSQVNSRLIDLTLPGNNIPRVFVNTGIEYNLMLEFVKEQAKKDKRIIIINNTTNIPRMLKREGYPFKSKQHSQNYGVYFRNKKEVHEEFKKIEQNPELKFDYDYIHNLSKGTKTIIKYVLGIREKATPIGVERERERVISTSIQTVPKTLMYQFEEELPFLISDKCCLRLKEEPLAKYAKENNKPIAILGIRNDEGGRRSINKGCLSGTKEIKFSPLKVISDEWEQEFIKRENIEVCELYKPPYNFKRTGCKGCPFNKDIQRELLTMKKLLPKEYSQCLHIWKPIYDEYVRIGYRLDKDFYSKIVQFTLNDYLTDQEATNA